MPNNLGREKIKEFTPEIWAAIVEWCHPRPIFNVPDPRFVLPTSPLSHRVRRQQVWLDQPIWRTSSLPTRPLAQQCL
jgi:hypothetical protein